ncbi:MAG: RIP metalloprotease RseP [Proteobacteria bacterium]|nr:MAG: RIP metalloprotease RseP [Pseudomonadota bacterium]
MPDLLTILLGKLEYIFAIVTLLGGVIAIHEFGHFIFAKWSGIRVDTFSIGFGPKLFSKKWGETEYALSLIPLGGFVKIYGQDPEEVANDPNPQPSRSFSHKSLWRKISVLVGGPLFNYFLAVAIFALLAMAGVEKFPAIATRVMPATPAYLAGLRSGDVINAVDGQATRTFDEVMEIISRNPDKTLSLSLLREGAPQELKVKVQQEHALTPYGEKSMAGVLEGLDPSARDAVVGISSANQSWGLKNEDRIVEVNGVAVSFWEEFEKGVAKAMETASPIALKVKRGSETVALNSGDIKESAKAAKGDVTVFLDNAGVHNPELFVREVVGGSAAANAGLKVGDRIISAAGEKIYGFDHLRAIVQRQGEKAAKAAGATKPADDLYANSLSLSIEREGKTETLNSAIKANQGKDPLGEAIVTYTIGILSNGKPKKPANMIVERTLNPFKAIWIGTGETINHTVMTVVGLKKLAFGEVSAKSVGGPIMIGKLAGDTLSERGWEDFLRIMAIISISLGVFNLIPVPILDGGHIVFAVMESIRGRPLSQNVQQMFLKVGLSMILLLMVFALYNDISRVLPLKF